MWKRRELAQLARRVDRKLIADDEIVRRLSDVVLQLRVATRQAELILRELKKDEEYLEDDDDQP